MSSLQSEPAQKINLYQIITKIHQSLQLGDALATTAEQVRGFLGIDRVMIYRFRDDGSGEVIAESIFAKRLPALQGLCFPADDIPQEARQMFLAVRQRAIVNVATGKTGLSPADSAQTGEPIIPPQIHYRTVDPCHLAYLEAMGVKSSLVMPLVIDQLGAETDRFCEIPRKSAQLWGLLVAHHSEPHEFLPEELQQMQLIVDQVSVAIAQATLLSQTRQRALEEATINCISNLLHQQPTIQFNQALAATVEAFEGIGGRLYLGASEAQPSQIFTSGEQPVTSTGEVEAILEEHPLWQRWIQDGFPKDGSNATVFSSVWPVINLYQEPALRVLTPRFQQTPIRGLLVIPIYARQQFLGILTIFRPEIETETLWAGRFDPSTKQTLPRQSFAAWREHQQGQTQPWIHPDLSLAEALGRQFAMAIEQYKLYQEIAGFNSQLEQQVSDRTAQLEKSLQVTQALNQVNQRISQTLELQTILSTIVQEAQSLIHSDRVLVYRLLNDHEGEVMIEALGPGIAATVGIKTPEGCFPLTAKHSYRQGEIGMIENLHTRTLSSCHREFLQSLQIQANLVVPIVVNDELWGLLIAHQCYRSRIWTAEEIDLLQQLSSQAAIAIAQAELYNQARMMATREQANAAQLTATLAELRYTQIQLIQSEKMSSLGQLVAGIAHEINNPITFIAGNLTPAEEYCQDLLQLVALYDQHHPKPHPEIQDFAEKIELGYLAQDVSKLFASMKTGAQRIQQIVQSLRNFSRLDEADLKIADLHEGLDNALLIVQHRLQAKPGTPGIQVSKAYGALPHVECYPGLLNQVFLHLLNNAIDALEDVQRQSAAPFLLPTLKLRTKFDPQSQSVSLTIADNGCGIDPEIQGRIFDPFFTTKPVGQGTGLGLSISYQIIVQQHKGTLTCFSEVGQGTKFEIMLPV
ncbi:MAG: GAF domain-containing protein [Oscillatoriales cyanobacterium RM2_1_1]|nr:GAF domain-containing protein [Oscillatoriales cyanobacterium SM2_3_0]NJO46404.1 GAF domain-containing protein [Oscillatoriales cyanobacterium RM2_1_1]